MVKKIVLFIIICTFFFSFAKSDYYFGRQLWVYWDKPIQQAPVFVRLCYQKIRMVCQKQKWNLTLLSEQKLKDYLPAYQQFQRIKSNSKLPFKQSIADLIRLSIIQQHGGVWLDISSILIKGLSWLQDLQNYPYLLTNHNSSNSNPPDMIQFYISNFQNRIQEREQNGGLINFSPGYQIWFVSARKKTRAIMEWRNYFAQFFQQTFQHKVQLFSDQNMFFRNLDHTDYMTGNKAFYYFLQKEQRQLDKNLTLFSTRQNVNNKLNIWGIHGEYGPLAFALRIIPQLSQMMTLTIQQLQKKHFEIKFYVKITQVVRASIEESLKYQLQLGKKGISFEQFIKQNPTQQQCGSIKFIVQGSIMGFLLKSNRIAQELNLSTITVNQRNQWLTYCQSKVNFFSLITFHTYLSTLIAYLSNIFQGSVGKRQYIQFYQRQNLSWIDKGWLVIMANRLGLIITPISGFIVMALAGWLGLGVKIYQKIFQNTKSKQSTYHWTNWFSIHYVISVTPFFIYLSSLISSFRLFFSIDQFGGFDQQYIIVLVMIYCSFGIKLFKDKLNPKQNTPLYITNLNYQQFLCFTSPFIYYFSGKCLILSIQRRPQKSIALAIVVCLICPFLLQITQLISDNNKRKSSINTLLYFIQKMKGLNKIIILMWVLALCLLPNLKYFVYQNGQLMAYVVIKLAIFYVITVYIAVFIEVIRQIKLFGNRIQNNFEGIKIKSCLIAFFLISNMLILSYRTCNISFIWLLPPGHRILYQFTIIFGFMCINLSLLPYQNFTNPLKLDNIPQKSSLIQYLLTLLGPLITVIINYFYDQKGKNFLILTFIQWIFLLGTAIGIIAWNRCLANIYQSKVAYQQVGGGNQTNSPKSMLMVDIQN